MKDERGDEDRIRSYPLAAALLLAAVVAFAGGCQWSRGSDGSGSGKAELELSFKVLELPSLAKPVAPASRAISALLLSNATTLTVSLTPLDSGLSTPSPRTVGLSGSQVSVTFSDVEWGSYTVKAVAAGSGGDALFQRSLQLDVGASTQAATLTLMPAYFDATTITGTSYTFSSGSPLSTMVTGDMRIYAVPTSMLSPGGTVPAGHYKLQVIYSSSVWAIYALNSDGTLMMAGATTNAYGLTVNGGTSVYVPSNTAYVGPCSASAPSYLIIIDSGGSYPYFSLSNS